MVSGASNDASIVKALVYIAGWGLDEGESIERFRRLPVPHRCAPTILASPGSIGMASAKTDEASSGKVLLLLHRVLEGLVLSRVSSPSREKSSETTAPRLEVKELPRGLPENADASGMPLALARRLGGEAGQVVDSRGHPGADITISIGTQTTVTDASGHFALGNVSTPYALAAFSVARNMAVVYQGLTRADPTILWRQPLAGPDRRGQVDGTVTGGVPPSTAEVLVAWASPEARTQGTRLTSTYSLQFGWNGPATTTGSVHVLQISADARGLPTAFPGYGVRTGVTVSDLTVTSAIDITLTPPTPSAVHGTYTLPPGYIFDIKNLALEFADGAFFPLGFDDTTGPEFTYVVPDGIGATVDVLAEISGPGAFVLGRETGIPLGATNVAFALPPGAPRLAPADGATAVDTHTDFSWESFPGGVYLVTLTTTPPGPTYFVVTRDTHASIPQLAPLPLPSGIHYDWDVKAFAPFESVDDAAGASLFPRRGTSRFSRSATAGASSPGRSCARPAKQTQRTGAQGGRHGGERLQGDRTRR